MGKRAVLSVGLAVGIAFGVAGCGGGGGEKRTSTAANKRIKLADQWAGRVSGTNAYISVFTLNNGQAGAYLADGAAIATLVLGSVDGKAVSLRPADGTTVTVTSATDRLTGKVRLNGADHAFSAVRATGKGGWYRGRRVVAGQTVAGGFIVLSDGSFRGAIRRGKKVIAHPNFDPSHLALAVPGDGKLQVLPVAEFVRREQKLA